MSIKILLAIAHYGKENRQYLFECLNEYNNFGHKIDCHLYLTDEIDVSAYSNLNITKHICFLSLGHYLTYEHRKLFADSQGIYNYYIYCEDDVKITKQAFETAVQVNKSLPFPYVCGFLRYELQDGEDYKYLIDCHPAHSVHRQGSTIIKQRLVINGNEYLEPFNFHQGSYCLSSQTLDYVLTSKRYLERDGGYAGIRESAASDVFFKCGLTKVIPIDKVSSLLTHHLANKYVKMLPNVYTQKQTPDDNKFAELSL